MTEFASMNFWSEASASIIDEMPCISLAERLPSRKAAIFSILIPELNRLSMVCLLSPYTFVLFLGELMFVIVIVHCHTQCFGCFLVGLLLQIAHSDDVAVSFVWHKTQYSKSILMIEVVEVYIIRAVNSICSIS